MNGVTVYHPRDLNRTKPATIAEEGQAACHAGKSEADCPYVNQAARVAWLRGYREAAEWWARE